MRPRRPGSSSDNGAAAAVTVQEATVAVVSGAQQVPPRTGVPLAHTDGEGPRKKNLLGSFMKMCPPPHADHVSIGQFGTVPYLSRIRNILHSTQKYFSLETESL
jgi:hypothetical protein